MRQPQVLIWLVSIFHFRKENKLAAISVMPPNPVWNRKQFSSEDYLQSIESVFSYKTAPLWEACFLVLHKQTITKECLELWRLSGKTCHLQGDKYFSVLITLVVNFSFWELKCLHANCSLMTVYRVVLLCWEGYTLTLIFFFSSFRQTCVLLLCTRGVFPH